LFSSPAGSRPGSPSRTRPGSAGTRPGSATAGTGHCVRPGTAAHGVCDARQLSQQPGGWCKPGGVAAIAIPEAVCRTSSRLSPRRQQQQQGEDSDGVALGAPFVEGRGAAVAQQGVAGAAGGFNPVGGVRAVRGGGMLPYAVPAWLEEHL
jgi:hypothetical protein